MNLPLLFGLGFVTWLLVFLRSYALDTRRTWWLSGVIFADETLGISVGVWLARNGGWPEIVAVAAGGTVAAAVAVRLFRRLDR
jgi:hypothetical protein